MYCIINYGFCGNQYLTYQDNGDDFLILGYKFVNQIESFIQSIMYAHTKDHPVLFKTYDDAIDYISFLKNTSKRFSDYDFGVKYIDISIPKCGGECHKCNKGKSKYNCKHLRNPYQNLCGFRMAKFPDGFSPTKGRLDAPCEKCLNKECNYKIF